MKLSNVSIDGVQFETGEWVDTIPEMDDLRLKVRGIGNGDWRRLASKLNAAVPRDKKRGNIVDPETQDVILSTLLLDTCLLDWDGVTEDDDTVIPYSKAKATMLLTNPDFRRFRDAVLYAASLVGDITATAKVAAKGN